MDLNARAVLNKLHTLGGAEKYIIVSGDEFDDCLPQEISAGEVIRELADGGFVDVRYSRGDMYCLTVTKDEEAPASPRKRTLRGRIFDSVPVSAFFGAALGSIIAALVFAIF